MGSKKGCCCACCTPMVAVCSLIAVGVLIACLGAASIPLFKDLYEKQVKKQLVMKKGNEAYNAWQNPPAPVYMEYYLFNYTNYLDVLNNKAKPNVTQKGPYKYREVRTNTIVSYNEYNITYLQNYSYVFEPSLSCVNCSEDDVFYLPNLPVLTIAKKLHDFIKDFNSLEKLAFKAVDIYLQTKKRKGWKLFAQLSVHQLLWGYVDPFLFDLENVIKEIEKIWKLPIPPLNPFVQLQYNGTAEAESIGNLTIVTGKENIDHVQQIVEWRGKRVAPYWLTPYGEMINGSDGSHFQPFLTRDQKIYTFVTDICRFLSRNLCHLFFKNFKLALLDGTHSKPFTSRDDRVYVFTAELCRSLYFEYLVDRTLKEIELYRFHTTAELFADHYHNPDNAAFCDAEKCWPSGLLPVGQCQEGNPPVFMSAPHFYQGNATLIEAINGLHPQEKLHATFLDIEPITGITMEAHKRLQINVLVQYDDSITLLQYLVNENNFLPVMWVHEAAVIDDKSAEKFKSEVMTPRKLLTIIQYTLLGLGAFIVLISFIACVVVKNRKNKYTEFANNDETQGNIDNSGIGQDGGN